MQVKEKQLTPEQEKLMQSLIDDGYHKLIAKVLALSGRLRFRRYYHRTKNLCGG